DRIGCHLSLLTMGPPERDGWSTAEYIPKLPAAALVAMQWAERARTYRQGNGEGKPLPLCFQPKRRICDTAHFGHTTWSEPDATRPELVHDPDGRKPRGRRNRPIDGPGSGTEFRSLHRQPQVERHRRGRRRGSRPSSARSSATGRQSSPSFQGPTGIQDADLGLFRLP